LFILITVYFLLVLMLLPSTRRLEDFCVLVLVLVATERRVHGNEEGSLCAISLVELVWGTLKCHTRSEIFNVGGMGRQDPAALVVSGWRGEDKGVDV